MTRLTTPVSIATSPEASKPLLEAVNKQLGSVPNLYRVIGNSPAALEGFLNLNAGLGHGALDVKTRNRIAIAVAEANGCDYCLSAHAYLGKELVKLPADEILANRDGHSTDPKADAAVAFAVKIVRDRGHVSDADVSSVKSAGFTDAQIVEIVAHVAANTFTNYLNEVTKTVIDFPVLSTHRAA